MTFTNLGTWKRRQIRLKQQIKFDELFGRVKIKEYKGDIKEMSKEVLFKTITTGNYFLEVMLANVPEVRIVDFIRYKDGEHETTFEFPAYREIEIDGVVENTRCRAYGELSNFTELKRQRKVMLDNYFDGIRKGDR